MSTSVPLIRSPLYHEEKDPSPNDHPEVETHDETLFENPQFQHYEETTNIQLFFDLFFVANLTSFTEAHEVNSQTKLISYIGFLCILWFTWCQVTLYDVRFSTDSVYERIAHLCHFGVMVALAVSGPQFDDSTEQTQWATLQQISLTLMASRFVLLFQYASTTYFAWKYRTTRLPLLAVMSTLGVAAILYLGLSFAFSLETIHGAFIAWYIIAVLELASNIAIAGRWHVVSFKGTHLVERMTCLTLIILGEGVIGLTKSVTKIQELGNIGFSPAAIGTVACALLIIYFVYQLYFDNVQMEHFGILRQQIWTFLHFPFHMALVLLMEGTNQLVSWRHITEYMYNVFGPIFAIFGAIQNTSEFPAQSVMVDAFNLTMTAILNNTFFSLTDDQLNSIHDGYDILAGENGTSITYGSPEYIATMRDVLIRLLQIVFSGYNFEPPEIEEGADASEIYDKYFGVFNLIFVYFFVSAGVVLISFGVLTWVTLKGKGNGSRSRYIGIIANLLLGLALALLSIMETTSAAGNFGTSVWTLPLLVFILFIALLLNHTPWGVTLPKKLRFTSRQT